MLLLGLLSQVQAQSFNPNHVVIETMKLSEPIPAFGRIGGVTMDQLGNTYVANFRDGVWKVDPEGKVSLFANGLYGSSGNAVDQEGNVIQASFFGDYVVKIDRNGNRIKKYTENLDGPVGVTVDKDENVYVCNCKGNSITKFSRDGQSEVVAQGPQFNCPNGITIDPNGDLYVTNYHNDVIVKIDNHGKASEFVNLVPGQGNAHIAYLKDNFYVTKIKSNALFRVTPDGQSTIIAGHTGKRGLTNGNGDQATLSTPNGIAADPNSSTLIVNNIKGPWVINKVGPKTSIILRKVDIKSITEIFDEALNTEGLEAAVEAFEDYKTDPLHIHEELSKEITPYAWQLLIQRKFSASIRIFQLLAETYPDHWQPYYNLGQVYAMIGQIEEAKRLYEQSLKINPNNPVVEDKLKSL